MTAIEQPAPQKREALAIRSAARPFLTTSAKITIRGHRIQPWLSSATTRNARRWSSTHRQDPTTTPRAWSRGAFTPKPLLAQKRPFLRSGNGPNRPMRTSRTHRPRAYSPASLSASSLRAAARSPGLRSRSRAAHAIALLVTSRQCRPFSEIASSHHRTRGMHEVNSV